MPSSGPLHVPPSLGMLATRNPNWNRNRNQEVPNLILNLHLVPSVRPDLEDLTRGLHQDLNHTQQKRRHP
jgi:hypothetical protein